MYEVRQLSVWAVPVRAATALLILTLVGGCAARQVREMQDSFNTGSAAANPERLQAAAKPKYNMDPAKLGEALVHYKMARSLARQEIAEHRSQLIEDQLLDHAYAIWALSLWQITDIGYADLPDLKQNTEIDADAELAQINSGLCTAINDEGVKVAPLNRVAIGSVPGYLEFTKARLILQRYAEGSDEEKRKSIVKANSYVCSGIVQLEASLNQLGLASDHHVRAIWRVNELAALGIVEKAIEHAADSEPPLLTEAERNESEENLAAEARKIMCDLVYDSTRMADTDRVVTTFAQSLGVNAPFNHTEDEYTKTECSQSIPAKPSLCKEFRTKIASVQLFQCPLAAQ